jgi:hypothetical protein
VLRQIVMVRISEVVITMESILADSVSADVDE